jgi:hypothetical protein
MSVPDAVVAAVAAALPDADVWDGSTPFDDDDLLVFDGIVPPKPPRRYVVVYADPGTLAALAVCSESDAATFRWQVTSVGPDRQVASLLAVTIRDGIVDDRLTAVGWACGPVQHNYASLPAKDEQVQERPVVFQVDQYALLAARAAIPVTST